MADEEQQSPQPSLEVPRLFGRRRRKGSATESPDEASTAVGEPVAASPTEPVSEPVSKPVSDPASEQAEALETVADEPARESVREPVLETVPAARPDAVPAPPLFIDEVTAPESPATPRTRPAREPRARRETPLVAGRAAAALTGLVVGLVLVGATVGALRGCEAVQGTTSCNRAGFPLLVAIFLIAVVVGATLLRLFDVPDPTSTSLLAVGLVAVAALLFLLDVTDEWWMLLVIPAVSVATFVLSHWITTTFVEPAERSR